MTLEYIQIEDEACDHCNRAESDHDAHSNTDNNCSGYETPDEQYARETEEMALAPYEAHQAEVNAQ